MFSIYKKIRYYQCIFLHLYKDYNTAKVVKKSHIVDIYSTFYVKKYAHLFFGGNRKIGWKSDYRASFVQYLRSKSANISKQYAQRTVETKPHLNASP